MSRRMLVIVCGTVLLIAAAVVVALRERWQPLPSPEMLVAASPAEVRVKVVERKTGPRNRLGDCPHWKKVIENWINVAILLWFVK